MIQLARRVTEHLLPARREVALAGLEVPFPKPVVGSGHGPGVARLALLELSPVALPGCDAA